MTRGVPVEDVLATMRQNGVISPNESRALEEIDPISPKDGGDAYANT